METVVDVARVASPLPADPPAADPGPLAAAAAARYHPPEWARDAIWYQLMLDRFRNGDPSNDPQPVRPWTSDWFTPSPWEGRFGQEFYHSAFRRYYGGDLAGLTQKLPYLRDLGVNALYLTPVFKANSPHKYNTMSHVHVDDHFGRLGDYAAAAAHEDLLDPSTWTWTASDRMFLDFVGLAHEQGFRVILDAVFNHVGTDHPAFRDVFERRVASRFAHWFDVSIWAPLTYKGWWDHPELPVFKKGPRGFATDEVRQHIFEITRRWMAPDGDPRAGIDGWRLDVPNEIPLPFWREWCPFVRAINPQAFIVGEIWHRADEWLDGRAFDAVMNYELARSVVAWLFDRRQRISVREFDRRLSELRAAYPPALTQVMQNLMDSHDTDRLVSMAHNPDRSYNTANRLNEPGVTYDNSKPPPAAYARARLAVLIQMTYIGAPMVYYGDEVGMWGASDPTCRKPMLWQDLQPYDKPEENHVMEEHLAYYRQLIALRMAHPALRAGGFETLLCEDAADVWAFRRASEQEQLIVALNASDVARRVSIPLPAAAPTRWEIILGGSGTAGVAGGGLPLELAPMAGQVLVARG